MIECPGDVRLDSEGNPMTRQSGKHAGQIKRKVLRHDVVMEAKRHVGWSEMPPDQRPSLAQVAYEAGNVWLRDWESKLGFLMDNQALRVDGDANHCLKRRRDESGAAVASIFRPSILRGVLTVTDRTSFTKALLQGIGPVKGFGCGMLLIRRV